jgi:hypothetical protein
MDMLTQVGGTDLATKISCKATTPTARSEMKDRLIWTPAKRGIYTVKLAYQLLAGETSACQGQDRIWEAIW